MGKIVTFNLNGFMHGLVHFSLGFALAVVIFGVTCSEDTPPPPEGDVATIQLDLMPGHYVVFEDGVKVGEVTVAGGGAATFTVRSGKYIRIIRQGEG